MQGPSLYLDALIKELSRLPGIGQKSAARIAFHVLKMPPETVSALAASLEAVKKYISVCSVCGGISDGEICSICVDERRDRTVICIVEEAGDVLTIEKTAVFNGVYHVLGGVISPLDGIGPDDLNMRSLLARVSDGSVKEVVLATNPTIEGDATSLYVAKILKPLDVKVMRIARGLPVGANLDYADSATIAKSFYGRVEM